MASGGFGGLAYKLKLRFKTKQAKLTTWPFIAQVPHKVMVARFQFKYYVVPLLFFARLFAYIASPSAIYGGLLVSWF